MADWISLTEAAELAGISISGMSRRISRGQYQGMVRGSSWRKKVLRHEILELEDRRGRRAIPGFYSVSDLMPLLYPKRNLHYDQKHIKERWGLKSYTFVGQGCRLFYKKADVDAIVEFLKGCMTRSEAFDRLGHYGKAQSFHYMKRRYGLKPVKTPFRTAARWFSRFDVEKLERSTHPNHGHARLARTAKW